MSILDEYIVSIPPAEKNPFNISLTGITYKNPNYSISRENTSVTVVEYIISGTGYVECENAIYTVNAGDMYILQPYSNHKYYSDKLNPYQKIWFNSNGILLSELLRIYGISGKIIFKSANGYDYMNKILKICENKTLTGDEINTRTAAVALELIAFLAENDHKNTPKSEAVILKQYIDMNIEKNVTIDELSKQIFRSKSQTMRIFKNAYGHSPYDYLLSQRLLRANSFLQNTNIPIKDISQRLGFCDEHYFSNLYKKKTGMSPSDFRKAKK